MSAGVREGSPGGDGLSEASFGVGRFKVELSRNFEKMGSSV